MLLMLDFCRTTTCFVHSSHTIDQIDLKLFEHVSIIIMNLPYQNCGQWMYRFQEILKMAEGDRGQFLRNCALELAEIAWAGYYHPYASPHEADFEMDAQIWRK